MPVKSMPKSYPQSATIATKFCPSGPPSYTWGRWAKISPLSSPLWITLEQAPSFQRGPEKNEGKSQIFGYNFVTHKIQPEERRLAMNKRSKLNFSGQPIYIG